MFNAIWVIFHMRLLVARNTFWRGGLGRKAGAVFVIAISLVGAVTAFWVSKSVIGLTVKALHNPHFDAVLERTATRGPVELQPITSLDILMALEALPSGIFFFVLVLLLLTSVVSILSALYLSGDMEMLLVAPVPMRAVFVIKFFSGLQMSYLLLTIFLLPLAWGYGVGMDFGWLYFVVTPLVVYSIPLLPAGLGAIGVMGIVRVIPAHRVQELVAAIGGFIGIVIFMLSQLAPRAIGPQRAQQALAAINWLDSWMLPSSWAGRTLVAAGNHHPVALILYGGLFFGVSAGVFLVCLWVTERLYYTGWSNIAVGGRRRPAKLVTSDQLRLETHETFPIRLKNVILRIIPAGSRAIVYKDLRLIIRDFRNLQNLIIPLLLALFWMYQLVTGDFGVSDHRGDLARVFQRIGTTGITFFLCSSLSGALGPGVNREGKGYWQLKVAPLSAWQVLFGKFLLAYLPYPVIGTFFILLFSALRQGSLTEVLTSLGLIYVIGIGATSIVIGLHAIFPKLDWENPQQQATVKAGCLTPLLLLTYIGFAFAAVMGFAALGQAFPQFEIWLNVLGWGCCLILTGVVSWGTLVYAVESLERLEVEH
ncbi:MAG: hypothetical protein HY774_19120 [Acidobacteria bacterium]|nr:hypothetical protein [Acidobacteriota bacterium]